MLRLYDLNLDNQQSVDTRAADDEPEEIDYEDYYDESIELDIEEERPSTFDDCKF